VNGRSRCFVGRESTKMEPCNLLDGKPMRVRTSGLKISTTQLSRGKEDKIKLVRKCGERKERRTLGCPSTHAR